MVLRKCCTIYGIGNLSVFCCTMCLLLLSTKTTEEAKKIQDKTVQKNKAKITGVQSATPASISKTLLSDKNIESHKPQEDKAQKDARTLFVKNLPAQIKEEDLRRLSPDILQVRISNRPPMYAFITFADEKTAEKNFHLLKKKTLMRQEIFVDYVGNKRLNKPGNKQELKTREIDPCTLFISNLTEGISEADISKAFPNSAEVVLPKRKGMSFSRFGFIKFNSAEEAENSHDKSQNLKINSKPVRIAFAFKKHEPGNLEKRKAEDQGLQSAKKIKIEPKMSKYPVDDDDSEVEDIKGQNKEKQITNKNKNVEEDEDDDEEDDDDDDDDDEDEDDQKISQKNISKNDDEDDDDDDDDDEDE